MAYSQTIVWENNMPIGVYKARKRTREVGSIQPTLFISNFQAWLSVFGFATSAAGFLAVAWGWNVIRGWPSPFMVFSLVVVAVLFLAFAVIILVSLIMLVRMLWRGWHGVLVEYDPDNTPINVLEAIEATDKNTGLKGYKITVKQLDKERTRLSVLIAKYAKAIQDMESDNDKPESKGEK